MCLPKIFQRFSGYLVVGGMQWGSQSRSRRPGVWQPCHTHGTSTLCGVIMDKKSGASRDYGTFLVVVFWCYRARDSAQQEIFQGNEILGRWLSK